VQHVKARLWRAFRIAEYWTIAKIVFGLLALLRMLPARQAIAFVDRASRRIGPLLGRHRVALDNLALAFPGKPAAEREAIARDMWGNMARLAAEYVFLDQIFDFDPSRPGEGIVEVDGVPYFERLITEDGKPHIFFTAHMGNFELLPVCAAAFGLNVTALFRPPNNPFIAKRVLETRRTAMGHLVPSKAGAAWALARMLDAGGNVGMLVDQHFHRGIEGTFFGRPCRTNPLLAKLVRQYDCDVYPARCIRLPGGRFRLELFDKIPVPRNQSGEADIEGLTQVLNDTVEQWVREHPGQWQWFHKRWK
jgi:KDO2-lipid IV(A) lauroyltransferase